MTGFMTVMRQNPSPFPAAVAQLWRSATLPFEDRIHFVERRIRSSL
jgi:hypothetical protein